MESKNILCTVSGGRTSGFLAKFCKEHYKNDNIIFVFANTGKEREETLAFVNKLDKEFSLNIIWIEADVNPQKGVGTRYRIVDFETASRRGEPFYDVIKKYGLPSKVYRHCTRELKEVPMHKYAKDIFGSDYITTIGIRADEKHRISQKEGIVYPLVKMNIDEKFIREWWKKQSFDLGIKDYQGNCDLCFQKSQRKRLTIISEDPKTANWWIDMEDAFAKEYQDKFDMRGNISVSELVELAKYPFNKALDKQDLRDMQTEMFDFNLDYEESCFCKII